MHKNAGDLKAGDAFAMAGVHYRILDTYDTVDEDMIKVSFRANDPNPFRNRRLSMTLSRDLLFITL